MRPGHLTRGSQYRGCGYSVSCLGHDLALLVRTLENTETNVASFLRVCISSIQHRRHGEVAFVEVPSEIFGEAWRTRPPKRYLSTVSLAAKRVGNGGIGEFQQCQGPGSKDQLAHPRPTVTALTKLLSFGDDRE